MTLQRLGPSDAAVLETFVVPRYLTLFGEAALDMFLSSGAAAVVHLGCRTGYPDELIADRLSSGSIVGLDPSPPAIDLARTKGALIPSVSTDYEVFTGYPTGLAPGAFTHGISLHPSVVLDDRRSLMAEMARLIVPQGQVLLSLPMRGSFRCVVPDHIGCGLSDKPQDYPYTLAQHIENLVALVEKLDLKNVMLLAHDWGGAIGLGTALRLPERFRRIVLFNTGGALKYLDVLERR